MKSRTHVIAVRPPHASAARARFVVGVGVAVTGAVLWLADLARITAASA
jgi:hypothetical protein